MQDVRQIAEAIVDREGGYVNDRHDPGGATNHGITIHTMRRLGLDLTGDGQVDAGDVRALPRGRAVDILMDRYFDRPGIGRLPDCLQATVFDMYVNAGANAVRILQRLLGDMEFEVAIDGLIGPQTETAAERAAEPDPILLRDAYGIARRSYYFELADRRPASRKYARTKAGSKGGWIRRAEEFISPRFHLSEAEFGERVAAWG